MKRFLWLSVFILSKFAYGQNAEIRPTITPDFFSPDEEITITYDVTGTSLSSLSDAWLWLWLPDLDEVDVPSNVNPASSNSSATAPAKFTKSTEAGRVYFRISIVLTEFTNKSADEIKRVGVLIKGNDWGNGQSTDYVFDIADGYTLRVDSPTRRFAFYEAGDEVEFVALASESSTFDLLLDDETIFSQTATNTFEYTHAIIADGSAHRLQILAYTATDTAEFVHTYSTIPVTPQVPLPSGVQDGANYGPDAAKVTLVLTAPFKQNVFVIGSFNDWGLDQNYLMNQDGDQFWLEISDLEPGREYIYQYLVDGNLILADPFTEKVSSVFDDGQIISENRYTNLMPYPTGKTVQEASFLQTAKPTYNWQVTDFQKPKVEDLIIYELLVRDFSEERTYRAVIDKLDYLDSIGINAIQLMPVMEFEGNLSWGYNPSFLFAPDKFYGTEDELKELIDKAHERGMAIILDIVLNHAFGRSPMVRMYASGDFGPPTAQNVWFNTSPTHDFNVGYDFNHESQYTKSYVDRVVTYWTETYKADGYRFDLSKGFTQKRTIGNVEAWGRYDAARVALLKRMADVIWAQDPSTYVILEHFADNDEETELANYGMLLWGNMNHTFRNTAKGNSSDINWLYHGTRGWNDPHLIGYMESHDEERVYWDLGRTSADPFAYQMNRMQLNAAFFFLVPGPKMIWQFGEFGYDEELNNDRLGIKPTRWEYLDDPDRRRLLATYQSLMNLRTQTDYVKPEYFTWKSSGAVKWINIDHPDVKICAYGNFSRNEASGSANFLSAGTWYNYFTGEQIEVTDPDAEITLAPGEFYVFTSSPIENYIQVNPESFVTATHEFILKDVTLYPNPTTDFLNISTEHEVLWVRITDASGRVVLEQRKATNQVNISSLKPGIYLVETGTREGVGMNRVLKLRDN